MKGKKSDKIRITASPWNLGEYRGTIKAPDH